MIVIIYWYKILGHSMILSTNNMINSVWYKAIRNLNIQQNSMMQEMFRDFIDSEHCSAKQNRNSNSLVLMQRVRSQDGISKSDAHEISVEILLVFMMGWRYIYFQQRGSWSDSPERESHVRWLGCLMFTYTWLTRMVWCSLEVYMPCE
jgi:hypothetical protein